MIVSALEVLQQCTIYIYVYVLTHLLQFLQVVDQKPVVSVCDDEDEIAYFTVR